MSMNSVLQAIDEALDHAAGAVALDFSSIGRIDPAGLQALEELACAAGEKALKVTLHGVNPDVYRVLKLVKLDSRFSFDN